MTNIKRPFFLQLDSTNRHHDNSNLIDQRNNGDVNFNDYINNDYKSLRSERPNNFESAGNNKSDHGSSVAPGTARRPIKLRLNSDKWHNIGDNIDDLNDATQFANYNNGERNASKRACNSSNNNWSCQSSSQFHSTDHPASSISSSSSTIPTNSSDSRLQTNSSNASRRNVKSRSAPAASIDSNYEHANTSSSTSLKKNRYSANSVSSITSSSASSEYSSPNVSPTTVSPTSTTTCNESPSLILPYLYVGDQDQTQIDTISNLNISYILSLQSLPKFLAKHELDPHSDPDKPNQRDAAADVEVEAADTSGGASNDGSLLPSINSSKDYLVKIKSANPVPGHPEEKMNVDKIPEYNERMEFDGDQDVCTSQQHELTLVKTPDDDKQTSTNAKQLDLQNQADNHNNENNASNKQSQCQSSLATASKQSMIASTSQALSGRCNKISSRVQRLIRGKCINISDTFEQLLDKFFDEAHNFIEEARRNKCNILVHCRAGISRSPTIAIAYLMKWKRLHLQDAYNLVKRCRPQISPNLNFMGQLVSYERYLQCNKFKLPSPLSSCCPSPVKSENNMSSDEDKAKPTDPRVLSA